MGPMPARSGSRYRAVESPWTRRDAITVGRDRFEERLVAKVAVIQPEQIERDEARLDLTVHQGIGRVSGLRRSRYGLQRLGEVEATPTIVPRDELDGAAREVGERPESIVLQ